MANEKMYDLAFEFKKTALWRQMTDDQLFAVKLPDGEIGYCCVMGKLGQHLSLAIYVGETGYNSYLKLRNNDPYNFDPDVEDLMCQDCLQCSFEDKDLLSEEELKEVRQYAKQHNIVLSGSNAFPQFTKYKPVKFPWRFDSETDNQRMCIALSAAIELKKYLSNHTAKEIGLLPFSISNNRIPLLCYSKDKWIFAHTPLPPRKKEEYPAPVYENDIMLAKLRKNQKVGTWEFGMVRVQEPLQDKKDAAPYYPLVLIAIDRKEKFTYPPVITTGDDAEEMVDKFVNSRLIKICPKQIYVDDERSYSLLKDLCSKAGIQLTQKDSLAMLDECKKNLKHAFSDKNGGMNSPDPIDVEDEEAVHFYLLEFLPMFTNEELRQLGPALLNKLLDTAKANHLTDQAKRIQSLLK